MFTNSKQSKPKAIQIGLSAEFRAKFIGKSLNEVGFELQASGLLDEKQPIDILKKEFESGSVMFNFVYNLKDGTKYVVQLSKALSADYAAGTLTLETLMDCQFYELNMSVPVRENGIIKRNPVTQEVIYETDLQGNLLKSKSMNLGREANTDFGVSTDFLAKQPKAVGDQPKAKAATA